MKTFYEFEESGKKYAIKKLNRRERDDVHIVYSAYLGKLIKKGLLTRSMLENKYIDSGGTLSDEENGQRIEVLRKYIAAASEIKDIDSKKRITKKDEAKKEELENQIKLMERELSNIRQVEESLFNNTADTIAYSQTINWVVTQSLLVEKGGNWEFFFDIGLDQDDILEQLFEMEEDGTDEQVALIERASFIVTMQYQGLKPEDIKEQDEAYLSLLEKSSE